jgi:hypothetical protein
LAADGSRRRRQFRMWPDTQIGTASVSLTRTTAGAGVAVRAGDETRERAEKLAYISRRPARAEDVGWIKLILL